MIHVVPPSPEHVNDYYDENGSVHSSSDIKKDGDVVSAVEEKDPQLNCSNPASARSVNLSNNLKCSPHKKSKRYHSIWAASLPKELKKKREDPEILKYSPSKNRKRNYHSIWAASLPKDLRNLGTGLGSKRI